MSPIEAFIDSAQVVDTSEGPSLRLAGWTFATQGQIVAVQAWAGETLLGYLPYGFPRPDVARHFHGVSGSLQSGFAGQVKLPPESSSLVNPAYRMTFVTDRLERQEFTVTPHAASPVQASPPADELPLAVPTEPMDTTPAVLAAPNFFILGAGKCGTSSLYHALKQHPQIHLPEVKEPSFFSEGFQVVKNPVDYFNLFPAQEGKRRYGEASHLYFSAPETAPILRALFPEAKFLLILRDPVQRAYSLYQHMRRAGDEPCATFEEALTREQRRFHDPVFKRGCPQYFWNYMYCRSSFYDRQLRHYLDLFPLRQFLVLTLGEWKSQPEDWLRTIFEFLEIDPAVSVGTEAQNQASDYAPMAEDTRQRLHEIFQGVKEQVEQMIGRTLQHWED